MLGGTLPSGMVAHCLDHTFKSDSGDNTLRSCSWRMAGINAPSDLLLLRTPGFLSTEDRPFHAVLDIVEEQLTFALRQHHASERHELQWKAFAVSNGISYHLTLRINNSLSMRSSTGSKISSCSLKLIKATFRSKPWSSFRAAACSGDNFSTGTVPPPVIA
jgi:hypothetical protein